MERVWSLKLLLTDMAAPYSQASADLLLDSIIGKPVEEIKKLTKNDVLELLGIELGPVRLKCAHAFTKDPQSRRVRVGRSQ